MTQFYIKLYLYIDMKGPMKVYRLEIFRSNTGFKLFIMMVKKSSYAKFQLIHNDGICK